MVLQNSDKKKGDSGSGKDDKAEELAEKGAGGDTGQEIEPEKAGLYGNFGIKLKSEELKHHIIAGNPTTFDMQIINKGRKKDDVHMNITTINPLRSEESPEWFIKMFKNGNELFEYEMQDVLENDFKSIDGGATLNLSIEVTAPHSVDYGERVDMVITCNSKNDPAQSDSITFTILVRQSILAIKTSIGHERTVADTLYNRAKRKETGIYSILAPEKLRGYVLVETINPDGLGKVVKGIKRGRGVVEGDIPMHEINHFLTPKPLVAGIVEGDIVELIAGPFKGEKARVQQIEESKEEITVELFEAVVPIPITIRGDHVRVLETEGR